MWQIDRTHERNSPTTHIYLSKLFTFTTHTAYTSSALITISCNDCCILLSTSVGADPELVVGGWSCMLLLHPVLTCADAGAGPDLCTLHPDLCTLCLQWLSPAAIYGGGVSPSDVGTDSPCTRGGFTHYNLHRWCFTFYPLAQIPDLHSGNLHCVVVVFWWWWWWWWCIYGCIMYVTVYFINIG